MDKSEFAARTYTERFENGLLTDTLEKFRVAFER